MRTYTPSHPRLVLCAGQDADDPLSLSFSRACGKGKLRACVMRDCETPLGVDASAPVEMSTGPPYDIWDPRVDEASVPRSVHVATIDIGTDVSCAEKRREMRIRRHERTTSDTS